MGISKWLFGTPIEDEKQITEVEQLFGYKLPDDFKKCIVINNGGSPVPNTFDCDDGRIGAVFNNLLSFTDVNINIRMFSEYAPQKLIPFARDPFGNLLCFDYSTSEKFPKVVFYDCEGTSSKVINPICDSFTELLDRLYSMNN